MSAKKFTIRINERINLHNTLRDGLKIYLRQLGFVIMKNKFNSYSPDIVAYRDIDRFVFEVVFSHLRKDIFYRFAEIKNYRKIVVLPTDHFYDLIKRKRLSLRELESCFKFFEIINI